MRRPAVTIKDIAQASGVSYPTVSHVLNNTRPVASATRERVLAAVRQLNYHPNAIARGLLKRRMNTLGVVLPYTTAFVISDPYLGPLLEGILHVCQQRGQTALLWGSPRAGGDLLAGVPGYCDGRADGVLFIHEPTNSPLVEAMQQTLVPFVCINEAVLPCTVSVADIAQEAGAQELVQYLIRQGHRRIAFFGGDAHVISAQQRLRGFQSTMEQAGLMVRPEWVVPGDYNTASGRERAAWLWGPERPVEARPTAVVCANDLIAFGVLATLREQNLSVPEQVSVVGFDDIPASALQTPPLTTMRLPFRDSAVAAAQMLLRHIEHGTSEPETQFLQMTLVERQTVAAPPH